MTTNEWLGPLFDQCHERLYRLASRMVNDREEARDLVQEVFLRAARRPLALQTRPELAESWLFRVLINLCRDQYRRRAVRAQATTFQLVEPTPAANPERQLIARDLVRAFLTTLGPRRRAVVALCELEERSATEVATLLRLRAVTVRWHLAAARRQLATWRALHAPDRTSRP